MVRVKLDQETFGLSSMIEKLTKAKIKDCFKEDDMIYVVVSSFEMGKIIGKGGEMIRKLKEKLGKPIKVMKYDDSVIGFVKNVIYPLKVEEVIEDGDIVYLKDSQKKTKGLLMGREGRNLRLINRAVKRFFNVEVKIVK